MAVGMLIVLVATRTLNARSLGDDAAVGLGVNVAGARLVLGLAIILLCGAAVALAGPIGFLGLVVPHAARLLVGGDYRRLVQIGRASCRERAESWRGGVESRKGSVVASIG